MEIEKKNVFKTDVVLLALLQDMCKKTGKVNKEDFIEEAVSLLSEIEEFSSRVSVRNIVLYHLKQIINNKDVKIEYENGKEMLYLLKKYPFTIAKVFSFKGLTFLTILSLILFAFSIFWTIATKEWIIIVVCGIILFSTLTVLVSYETNLIIKSKRK
jgi:hypothetical protein